MSLMLRFGRLLLLCQPSLTSFLCTDAGICDDCDVVSPCPARNTESADGRSVNHEEVGKYGSVIESRRACRGWKHCFRRRARSPRRPRRCCDSGCSCRRASSGIVSRRCPRRRHRRRSRAKAARRNPKATALTVAEDTSGGACAESTPPVSFTIKNKGTATAYVTFEGSPAFSLPASETEDICVYGGAAGEQATLGLSDEKDTVNYASTLTITLSD